MNLQEPVVEFMDERNIILVDAWSIATSAGIISVLPGATSDGASTPEIIWSLPGFNPFEGDTFPAAFAHDQLYAGELCPREQADQVLKELLIANGVSWERAETYWAAVREFGGNVWNTHTPEGIALARKFATLTKI